MFNGIGGHRQNGGHPRTGVDRSSSKGTGDPGDPNSAGGTNPNKTPAIGPWGAGKGSYTDQLRQQINVTNMQIRERLDEVKAELQEIRGLVNQLIAHCQDLDPKNLDPKIRPYIQEVIENLQGTDTALGRAQDRVEKCKVGVTANIGVAGSCLDKAWEAAKDNKELQNKIKEVESRLKGIGKFFMPTVSSAKPTLKEVDFNSKYKEKTEPVPSNDEIDELLAELEEDELPTDQEIDKLPADQEIDELLAELLAEQENSTSKNDSKVQKNDRVPDSIEDLENLDDLDSWLERLQALSPTTQNATTHANKVPTDRSRSNNGDTE